MRKATKHSLVVAAVAPPDCHRELCVHTELLADGFVDLVEGGAVTGTRKGSHRNKVIATSALVGRPARLHARAMGYLT